jgi:hypothetical protein
MLRLTTLLALALLLLAAFVVASGDADAMTPPGDQICHTRYMPGDGPDLYAIFDEAGSIVSYELGQVRTAAPLSAPATPLDRASTWDQVCVNWLNICGPMIPAIVDQL